MTPFEHLAVLISLVLGLAIAQLLTTAHRLVLARERVRFYWLPLTWATPWACMRRGMARISAKR